MNIDSIKNGYVIDHIKAGNGMKIYNYLNLDELDCAVAIIKNVKSSKLGKKDIIKIDEYIELNTDVLGYIDPGITINIIKDSNIIKKYHPELPERIKNTLKCKNPRCITSIEKDLDQIFILTDRENEVYRCRYCEMSLKQKN